MCNHPEVMKFHRFGKFSGHYDKEDPPKWCPELKNEKEKKDMEDKGKRIHKQLVNIPIGHLAPHPNNPRKDIGDVEELAKSIEVNGLMQNLTVVPKNADEPVTPTSDFIVLIGHRRLAAAKKAGLTELPCKIIEGLSDREQLSTMLEENMQRTDLTIYEQAEGFQMMLDLGETMDTLMEKTGFSETTIRHRLNIAKLDKKKLQEAEDSFQISIKDLSLLEGIENIKTRNRVLSECYDHRDFEWKVRSAVQDEKRDKAEKELLKLLKQYNVKKAPENLHFYDPDVIAVKTFDLDLKLPKKSFKWEREPEKGKELYYIRAYGSNVKIIYKGNPKKAEKTPEEIKRANIEKARKKAKAIMEGFASDRRSFVLDVVNGKYSAPEDPEGITRECFGLLLELSTSISYHDLAGYLSNKSYWDLSEKEREEYEKKAKKLSMDQVILIMADSRIGGDTNVMDYYGHYYNKGEKYSDSPCYLLRLIGILEKLGFQMDAPEVEDLLDGTSDLYVKEDKKK